jgi:hypothetical protein
MDSYFAVTGHWVEEHAPGEWNLEHALLGFAQMNCAHNGSRLGQVLYKVCNQLQIVHKVSILVLCTTCSAPAYPCFACHGSTRDTPEKRGVR